MPRALAALLVVFGSDIVPPRALGCTLCGINLANQLTLRQEVAQARMVLFGTLQNPRLDPNNPSGGFTDLVIERVLKDDPFRAGRDRLELPRLVSVDPKNPQKFLVFCDIFNGKLDPYRGIAVKTGAIVEYVRGAVALPTDDKVTELLYFSRYLEHSDADIARDAFMEFGKSSDEEVGRVASRLTPGKIGTWLQDPQTPAERLSLYAFLLGACGGDAEARLLEGMLRKPSDRIVGSLGGLLAGYIQLRPAEGWDQCYALLRDADRPFAERLGGLNALRFYQGWKGDASKRAILRGMVLLLDQGDMADLAIEDLRRWKWWDLTDAVLAQWGKKSHSAPIMKRTIVRYALSCPQPVAARFLDDLRKQDRDLVQEVSESLQFEKTSR
jgi:hypothetical protein